MGANWEEAGSSVVPREVMLQWVEYEEVLERWLLHGLLADWMLRLRRRKQVS